MNRKTVQSIAIIAIFITGAFLLFYPLVGNWWNERRYDMLVSGYTQRVQVNPSGEDYAEFKRIDAYNATVPGKGVPDAFAVTTPEEDAEYTSFLNEDPNGVMAYINIPRLKSTLPIYHYTGIAAERRRPSTWLRLARRRQKHARRALRTPRPADLTPVHRP